MDRLETGAGGTFERCLQAGDLEGAAELVSTLPRPRIVAELTRLVAVLAQREADHRKAGEIREAHRLRRRRRALLVFRDHGLDLARLLPSVRLPQGYEGKILLLMVSGGAANGRVLLRCGDEWHREILRDTREEVADLGFSRSQVDTMGGAWARFEEDGAISIWGASEEFGACDRQQAIDLIRRAHPDRLVRVIEQGV